MPDLIKVRYRNVTSGSPATTIAAEAGEILVNLVDRKIFVRDPAGLPTTVADRIALYSATRQYASGDLTIQAAVLYRCITPITVPEAFNPVKWEAIGAAVGLDGAVLLAPNSATRNTITPTGDFPALRVLPAGGQSVALVNINGTQHDRRGIPVGRYAEAVFLVSQTSHPFSAIGQPAAYVHPNWVLAKAGDATLNVRAVVHEIIDANNVLLQMSGQVKNLSTAAFLGGTVTPGSAYFLSATAGRLSATPDASGAQATLLVTSATTGLLLLSNVAGAAIVSRTPGGQEQTIYEPLRILSTDGSNGLRIAPNTQSITAINGPVSLTFQQDGVLAVGGSLSITGGTKLIGNPVVVNSAPAYHLEETGQTAPAGKFRWRVNGDIAYLQRLNTAPDTWDDIWAGDETFFAIRPTLEVAGGILSPTVYPVADDADNSVALTIGIARSWQFAQFGVDAGAGLELRPTVAGKSMRIVDAGRATGFLIAPATRTLTGIGGAITISGDLAITGKATAASATIGAFDINVTAGVFKRTTGSIIYDVPTAFQHQFRINNVNAAIVEVAGTAVVSSLAIVTVEKGDLRFLNKAAGGTVAGATTFSAAANFTGGLTSELIRIGIKATNKIDVPTGSLAFDVPSGSIYIFEVNDAEIARISGSSTISTTMLLTAAVGDARYPQLVGGRVPIAEGGTAANDPLEARVNLGTNDAANLTEGTLSTARLSTSTSARDWVLARIADASHGVEGTYGFMECPDTLSPGSNHSGNVLEWAGVRTGHTSNSGVHPSGNWKAMGHMGTSNDDHATLFMRYA